MKGFLSMFSRTLYATLLTIVVVSFAVFTLEPYPASLFIRYPWGWELELGTRWMLLITFFKGALLALLVNGLYQRVFHLVRKDKPLSAEKVQWLKDDYTTRIQALEDQNRQLVAFNATLETAMQKLQTTATTALLEAPQPNGDSSTPPPTP
jgi:hypothetical protein